MLAFFNVWTILSTRALKGGLNGATRFGIVRAFVTAFIQAAENEAGPISFTITARLPYINNVLLQRI